MINIHLENHQQSEKLEHYINTLNASDKAILESLPNEQITATIDGLNLACPMPLLKTKVALRDMNEGESVYVLATDPNSQTDLMAFCKHAKLDVSFVAQSNNVAMFESKDSLEKLDTIFHLIITKTYGN